MREGAKSHLLDRPALPGRTDPPANGRVIEGDHDPMLVHEAFDRLGKRLGGDLSCEILFDLEEKVHFRLGRYLGIQTLHRLAHLCDLSETGGGLVSGSRSMYSLDILMSSVRCAVRARGQRMWGRGSVQKDKGEGVRIGANLELPGGHPFAVRAILHLVLPSQDPLGTPDAAVSHHLGLWVLAVRGRMRGIPSLGGIRRWRLGRCLVHRLRSLVRGTDRPPRLGGLDLLLVGSERLGRLGGRQDCS
jgi:hypothetical protein